MITKPKPESQHLEAIERTRESVARLREQLAKVIIGQGGVVSQVLIAILALTGTIASMVGDSDKPRPINSPDHPGRT